MGYRLILNIDIPLFENMDEVASELYNVLNKHGLTFNIQRELDIESYQSWSVNADTYYGYGTNPRTEEEDFIEECEMDL